MTYFINEEMVGNEATREDAKKMVELLSDRGYDVEYGQSITQTGFDDDGQPVIDDTDWDDCLSQL